MGRIALSQAGVFLAIALTLSATTPALAKAGMRSWLMSPVPRWAAPGTVLHLSWIVRDDEGNSFNAIGVFVRLTSGSFGVEPNEAFATPTAHPTGEYEADVTVPEGGIGRIEFGVAGTASGPNVPPRRSDMLFPVANLVWTTDEARPSGLPPPDSRTHRVTSLSPTAGAILVTSIPLNAPEGSRLRVLWRIRHGDGGYDFGAIGMFVRLVGRTAGAATEGLSPPTRAPEEPYEAEVAVPPGGIAHVEFGIAGYAGAQRSDRLFPIVDAVYRPDEIAPANPRDTPPPGEMPEWQWSPIIALTGGVALIVAVLFRVLAHRRRHGRVSTTAFGS